MPKNFKLVKIVPGNGGSGRITTPKEYLKQVGAKPGGYLISYADRVRIPDNVAKDVECEQNLEANALIYVPVTFQRKDSDTAKKK